MVDGAAPRPLTKLSFRRDVRLFLLVLAGFLSLLIVVLIVLLLTSAQTLETATEERSNAIADAASRELASPPDATLGTRASLVLARYDIGSITVTTAGKPPRQFTSGTPVGDPQTIRRSVEGTDFTFVFDRSRNDALQRTFRYSTAICLAAASCGMVLLFFYLPRITRPIELLLDQARGIAERDAGVEEESYLVDTFRDTIATLRRQEAELHRLHDEQKSRADDLERVTAALTRSLTSGFIAVDANERIVDLNAAAREILRLDRTRDFAGAQLRDVISDGPFRQALLDAIASHTALTRHEIGHTAGDVSLVIGVTTVPLLAADETYLGLLALFTDLTPIRRLEGRVREMEKLADIGEISAGVAHEFRNSLATILGYLRLARRDDPSGATTERLRRIEEEASQLNTAVERFLNFARPMTLDRRPLSLAALARSVAERMDVDAQKISITGPAAMISGDSVLLSRAVENVLRNALDAVRERGADGRVEVITRDDPPTLIVRDNGVGLDARDAAKYFLPFQSNKADGFGMGLALARKIVVLHDGEIELTGTPGTGAEATMRFPALSS